LISTLIYRSLSWEEFMESLVEAGVLTAMIMFIVGWAGLFSWTGSVTGLIDTTAEWLIGATGNPYVMALLVSALVLVLGMFMDPISIMYLVVPVLIPVMNSLDLHPIWFGVTFVCALAIGQATPPVGVNLFTAAGLIRQPVDAIAREAIPLVAAAVLALIVIALWPSVSLVLLD
jgi:C4-dicarboxylate transporter DctM subunit